MDKTLGDYIKRTQDRLEEENKKQSIPPVTKPEDYFVYPEEDNYDRPRNPYSTV